HPGGQDFETVGIRSSEGDPLWRRSVRGAERDASYDVAVAGSSAVVTGISASANGYDILTIGYDTATGTAVWRRRYDDPSHGNDVPTSIAASSDGTAVYVTGWSTGTTGSQDFRTLAYAA